MSEPKKKTDSQIPKDVNKKNEVAADEKKADEHAPENRMTSFKIRAITTILMLGGFVLILSLGHAY